MTAPGMVHFLGGRALCVGGPFRARGCVRALTVEHAGIAMPGAPRSKEAEAPGMVVAEGRPFRRARVMRSVI